jgi:hypothetical protein
MTGATLFVSTVTVAFGVSVAASPELWAEIWGRRRLDKMPQSRKTLYLRCYRASGLLLCLAGILLAAEKIWA